MSPTTASYGTWDSPVSVDVVLKSGADVDELFVDPITSTIYHVERRPAEAGRNVIVNTEKGVDVVGKEWNVRSGVHEYGGAPAAAYDGVIYFSNIIDNRVYRIKNGEVPEAVVPENKDYRFASFAVHPKQKHLIVAILENHKNPEPSKVTNILCVIDAAKKTVTHLVSGADFYSNPKFSPDGLHLAWQQWDHPDMPWEGSQVYVADVEVSETDLNVKNKKHIAGKPSTVSAAYPHWATDDLLLFLSDASDYYNPWKYIPSTGEAAPVLSKEVDEDFGQPPWQLGFNSGTPLDPEGVMALYAALRGGKSVLYVVNVREGTLEELASPYAAISSVQRVTRDAVVFRGVRDDEGARAVLCSLKDAAAPTFTLLGAGAGDEFAALKPYVAMPQPMTLAVPGTGEPVHVLFYPPTNPDYVAPEGEKPPAVFYAHGGPTSIVQQGLSWQRTFYTSRGFAWVGVNYGGSSGYGRKYIQRLAGQWGVVDVVDCGVAATQLSRALVDGRRMAITGGSAGGYTVLQALCSAPGVFAAGTSSYGISDLFKLAEFTHKFESQYMFKLVGGTPESVPEVYKARSPVFNADKIKEPLLVLQGSEDKVVPPNQAEGIVDTIRKHGGRVDYVVFEGEGHGWRKEENQRKAIQTEFAFYADVFGLKK